MSSERLTSRMYELSWEVDTIEVGLVKEGWTKSKRRVMRCSEG